MSLAADQLSAWERDGYLVLPEFCPKSEVAALRAHMAELVAAFDPSEVATVFSTTAHTHAQDDYFLSSGDKIRYFFEDGALDPDGNLLVDRSVAINKVGHNLHNLDPVFTEFSRSPKFLGLAADLGFADPVLLQSMYIFKPPRLGGEVTWHTDHPFLWTEPQSVVGFWLAIDDATIENGCLWAIPGEHTQPARTRFRRNDTGAGTTMEVFDATPYDTSGKVPLEVEAGTLVVLHGTLPHASEPNRSALPRHAYTLHMIERDADYPADNWLQGVR